MEPNIWVCSLYYFSTLVFWICFLYC